MINTSLHGGRSIHRGARLGGDEGKLRALAQREGRSEAAIMTDVLEALLRMAGSDGSPGMATSRVARDARLTIRLAPEDRIALADRARYRKMASATYVSVPVRSHLRDLPPLPKEELAALTREIAELGAVGRTLQQIARAADNGARITGPDREGFAAFLKITQSLRDHMKALLKANERSWGQGYADN